MLPNIVKFVVVLDHDKKQKAYQRPKRKTMRPPSYLAYFYPIICLKFSEGLSTCQNDKAVNMALAKDKIWRIDLSELNKYAPQIPYGFLHYEIRIWWLFLRFCTLMNIFINMSDASNVSPTNLPVTTIFSESSKILWLRSAPNHLF